MNDIDDTRLEELKCPQCKNIGTIKRIPVRDSWQVVIGEVYQCSVCGWEKEAKGLYSD